MNFEKYLSHNEEVVRDAAKRLQQYREYVESGNMSKSEFEELAEDILDLEKVTKLKSKIKRMSLVETAFLELQDSLPGLFL